MEKIHAADFVSWLEERIALGCGYIMGTSGQDPKTLGEKSWYFRQYANRDEYTARQEEKAKYWLSHAPYVYDCAGLAEGAVVAKLGMPLSEINTKARFIYADWCKGANGTDMDKMPRVPGTAVFKYTRKPGDIHHIGYLEKPVIPGDTAGDWYVIEAKGVLYGVVRTRLNEDKRWNAWGQMVKYFDYAAVQPQPEKPVPGDIRITGGSVNLRRGPGAEYEVETVAHRGDTYTPVRTEDWVPVKVGDDVLWASGKYCEVVE